MGQLKTDGRAVDVVAPAGTINFGELYRIDGWTGFALDAIAAGDTIRKLALEVSSERIWYVTLPAGVTGARGDRLYWTAGAGLKSGAADLTGTVTGSVVAIVEEAKDGSNVAAVRAVNI